MHRDRVRPWGSCSLVLLLAVALLGTAAATPAQAQPVVKTVPWVSTNPLVPHDTISGRAIRVKGTTDVQGAPWQYFWDFGDGSASAPATVTDMWNLGATHAYTGAVGTTYTARLTVHNTSTGQSANKVYYVAIRASSLPVQVNIAIDEGLWYLHTTQTRAGNQGYWINGYAGGGYSSYSALNVNAFEVNGHLETGSADNPYTDTVARGLRNLFTELAASPIGLQTNGVGTFNPDSNGNGLGVYVWEGYPYYQGGMLVDAIVASGTPNAIATTGPANIIGRTYRSIVEDMADMYAYAQYDVSPGGGWRYNSNEFPDNSACQWAAIALIPAQRQWGIVVPQIVKDWNEAWLTYSQHPSGSFGYTSSNPTWGPYATTPSGMVQAAMDGIGRGNPLWDRAETFMRNNFGNTGTAFSSVRAYYYGLFSFVKALLLHDSNGDGVAEPISMLHSSTTGVPDIDWYSAEVATGAPTNGVARTLVNDQSAAGYWSGHNYDSRQHAMETAMAIIMLNRTIFTAGAPVAVAEAIPNPAVAGQLITLDGTGSYHQDPGKHITSWQWDLMGGTNFTLTGPVVTASWPSVGNYQVRLRVTDDGSPAATADTIVTVVVSIPPLVPTANAGGPYMFCPGMSYWYLDGTGSVNPDNGISQPGAPGDFIKEYAWDLDGDAQFDDATGPTPDVKVFFNSYPPGSYLIQLRVTDNTSVSFPASGLPDLASVASAVVNITSACACIDNLAARPKLTKIQLTWTPWTPAPHHYNVYRSTVSGGPYLKIAETTSTYSTYLDTSALVVGTTYYYVVRPASITNVETCQSNQASARPATR